MGLTAPEINKVMYHRAGLHNAIVQPNGALTTIRAVGITLPDGRQASVPSDLHTGAGQKIVNDPARLYSIWKKSIAEGRWPVYANTQALNRRDAYLDNAVMARDATYWTATHPGGN